MQPQTLQHITAMMGALGLWTDAPDLLLRTYSQAVAGIREDVIIETCVRFIRGEIEGFKRGKCPTTDVFTQECRSWQKTIEAQEWRAKHKKLTDQSQERRQEHSFEHRQKMIGLFAHLKAALAGNRESQRVLEPYGWKPNVAQSPHTSVQSADYELSPERAEMLKKIMALPDATSITAEQQSERRAIATQIDAATNKGA